MSQPTKKVGFSQLAAWIPTDLKNEIARLAVAAGERQVDMLERVLRAGVKAEKEAPAKEHPEP